MSRARAEDMPGGGGGGVYHPGGQRLRGFVNKKIPIVPQNVAVDGWRVICIKTIEKYE